MRAAVALALLVSSLSWAECKKDDFNRYLAAAVRLYEGLDYERALEQINKAKANSCGVHDDAVAGLYEGIVRSDLGDADNARAAFKASLLLEPDAEVPLKVSPKVKKVIEALRTEAKKELAPILAKQEEERRKKIAEENERIRREEEARRQAEARKADELRIAAENAKTEEARQRALDDQRRFEEQRRAEEARRAADERARVAALDAPKQRELTASEPRTGVDEAVIPKVETKKGRGVPVVSIVFAGAGLIAGGVGAYFGVTARDGQRTALGIADNQVERERRLSAANTNVIIADVLFAVAGVAGIAAIIALFAGPSE